MLKLSVQKSKVIISKGQKSNKNNVATCWFSMQLQAFGLVVETQTVPAVGRVLGDLNTYDRTVKEKEEENPVVAQNIPKAIHPNRWRMLPGSCV